MGDRWIGPGRKADPFSRGDVQVSSSDGLHEDPNFSTQHTGLWPYGPFVKRKGMEIVVILCQATAMAWIRATAQISHAQVILDSAGGPTIGAMVVEGSEIDEAQRLPRVRASLPDAVFEINDRAVVRRKDRISHDSCPVIVSSDPIVIGNQRGSARSIAVHIPISLRRPQNMCNANYQRAILSSCDMPGHPCGGFSEDLNSAQTHESIQHAATGRHHDGNSQPGPLPP